MKIILKNLLAGFLEGLKMFSENIAHLVNVILLSIVYIFAVGITTMIAKFFGKHFLELKIDKNCVSYWSDLNLKRKDLQEYLKQF